VVCLSIQKYEKMQEKSSGRITARVITPKLTAISVFGLKKVKRKPFTPMPAHWGRKLGSTKETDGTDAEAAGLCGAVSKQAAERGLNLRGDGCGFLRTVLYLYHRYMRRK
jgi:hypothetical protein